MQWAPTARSPRPHRGVCTGSQGHSGAGTLVPLSTVATQGESRTLVRDPSRQRVRPLGPNNANLRVCTQGTAMNEREGLRNPPARAPRVMVSITESHVYAGVDAAGFHLETRLHILQRATGSGAGFLLWSSRRGGTSDRHRVYVTTGERHVCHSTSEHADATFGGGSGQRVPPTTCP